MKTLRIPLFIALTLVVALLGACTSSPPDLSPTPTGTQATAPFDDALRSRVEATVAKVFEDTKATSWMVLVSQPGRGEIYLQSGDTGRDRNWRIGSVTKTFTGITVLRLAQRGELSLDDKLAKYITGIKYGKKITIRQLLAMQAGVYDYTSPSPANSAFDLDPAMPWTVAQTIDLIRKGKPGHKPGAATVYDNSNFVLLGRIIEKVTGKPAAEVIAKEAIEPAGLKHTIIPRGYTVPQPAVAGNYYQEDGKLRRVPRQNPRIPSTAGNMISTVDDLVAWSRALATGSLLEPEYFEQQKQFIDVGTGGMKYGYGLALMDWQGWLGHGGEVWGYSNVTMTDTATGATVVVMATGSTGEENSITAPAFALAASEIWPGAYPSFDDLAEQVKSLESSSPS
ncbi:MAG: serine hydrolase domain-containing protein [Candidatus Nanopelagicales bacterium]|nr:serine hydrolase domain-containing protein [Candidatus Nanopelagicales bacterium]MDZ4249821.1 serine hydrolase domain-containing protein [Candidatus Nanopelagicales bacterium]